ncbi:MAG: FtsX-like permease family protein [Terriglobia bacterium]|jgi:putative ABC transport system permease protein
MVNRLIISNILHRPIRTGVSVLAVAIEVAMVILVVGLCHGLVNDSARRVEGVGADILVQPPGASFLFALNQAPMPIKIGDRLAELPRVLAVAPTLFLVNSGQSLSIIYGIDLASFDRVSRGFVYHSGGPFQAPYDILVDDIYAHANHSKVGQTINLLNHDFRIAGIVEHGKGARMYIPLATAQDLLGAQNKASIFFVKCTDPAFREQTAEAIRTLLPPNYSIMQIQEYMELMTSNNLPGLNYFITAMIGIAVGIGFLVIFLSMYTTITERTREIGILKSLGASKTYIISVILREATLLTAVGIIAGYIGSVIMRKVLIGLFPTLPVQLTWDWRLYAACLALIGSLVGAFYPALRAARLDPVDALAYE